MSIVPIEYLPSEYEAYAHLPRWELVIIKLLTTSPVVSWRGWETPPPPPPPNITAQLSFFAQPPVSEHLSLSVDCPSLDVLFTFGG